MPDKIIEIPNVGRIAFPESMTPEAINQAAAKLYADANPKHPKPEASHSWIDTAVDWLPAAGGIVGGITGGIGGTVGGFGVGGAPGAIGGAALGGAAGEGARQVIQTLRGKDAPRTTGDALAGMGKQAAVQGGSELAGAAMGAAMAKAAPWLMESAVKVTGKSAIKAAKTGQTPPVVKTLLDEGINVSARGMEKLNTLLDATNEEIKHAIAGVQANVNPFKVTAKLGDTAQTFAAQANPKADLRAIGRAGNEFLESHPSLTLQEAQAVKTGTYKQLSGKYGELRNADVEAQKALARGLKDEIAHEMNGSLRGIKGALGLPGGIDISAANAREGALLEAQQALAKRLAVSNRQNPMGIASLAVTHPMTFMTALFDRSPAVKSLLARGLYSSAGAAAGVSPQLIKAALTAIATSGDTAAPTEP